MKVETGPHPHSAPRFRITSVPEFQKHFVSISRLANGTNVSTSVYRETCTLEKYRQNCINKYQSQEVRKLQRKAIKPVFKDRTF